MTLFCYVYLRSFEVLHFRRGHVVIEAPIRINILISKATIINSKTPLYKNQKTENLEAEIFCYAQSNSKQEPSQACNMNNAGINLTSYGTPPPLPSGHSGTFAPKCVPSPRAFAQQKMSGDRAYKRRCPSLSNMKSVNIVIWV